MIHRRLLALVSTALVWLSVALLAFGQTMSDAPAVNDPAGGVRNIRILVAYQSKYGSTKQYADWIRDECNCDPLNIEDEEIPDLAGYDIVIIGGSVRIGKIVVAPFIRDHWSVMNGKRIILFTTSATPPGHPKIQDIYERSLPEEIRKEIRYFPLHGRVSRERLTLWDTFLVAVGRIMEQDEALKRDMGKDFDSVRRENLLPLFAYLQEVRAALGAKKE